MKKPGRGDPGKGPRKKNNQNFKHTLPFFGITKKITSGIIPREIIFSPQRTSCLLKRAAAKGKPHRWRNQL
jgi:hypothetical protein